jgi:hypothetical protein
MDADPGIDRQHFSLVLQDKVRHRLSPAVWQVHSVVPFAGSDEGAENWAPLT